MQRRRYLKSAIVGVSTVMIAGCTGEDDEPPEEEEEEEEEEQEDEEEQEEEEQEEEEQEEEEQEEEEQEEEEQEQEEEEVDPDEALEDEDVESTRDGLEILEHEFYEDDFSGGVEGVVVNNTGEEIGYVEVGVVFYNEDGQRIADSFTNTTDLGDGEEWVFDVLLIGADPEDVDDYNIAVTDSPF